VTGDEAIAALDLPAVARVDRRVPKTLLLEYGAPTAAGQTAVLDRVSCRGGKTDLLEAAPAPHTALLTSLAPLGRGSG